MGFMHNFSLYYNIVKMLSFFLHTQPHVTSFNTETGTVDIGDQLVCNWSIMHSIAVFRD